jgi:DNA-binding transcriptional LysR family regulator
MGLGVALLMRSAVEHELSAGTLREVTIDGRELRVPVVLVHRIDKRFGAVQRRLIDEIARAMTEVAADRPNGRAAVSV